MTFHQVARRLWPAVERHISPVDHDPALGGRPRISDEIVFYKLVAFLRAGCSWQTFDELCRGSGVSGRTCRRRLAQWRADGIFERVCEELRELLPDADIAHLDAMFVRSRGGGDDLVGLTRHGKGSKLQVACNKHSLPLLYQLTSANPNESTTTEWLIEDTIKLPATVVADKAYDYDFLRDAFNQRGSTLLSPHRTNRSKLPRDQHHIGRHYKQRWRIERFFAWLAAWRRIATRWERHAEHYWQWLCLAISLIYTRQGIGHNF
jgi:transposase